MEYPYRQLVSPRGFHYVLNEKESPRRKTLFNFHMSVKLLFMCHCDDLLWVNKNLNTSWEEKEPN